MIRLLAALVMLVCAAPALADELRPVSIQFEQTAEREWSLGWKEPLAVSRGASLGMPQLPQGCVMEDVKRERAAAATLGHANVRCEGAVAGGRMGWDGLTGQGEAILRIAPLDGPVQVHRLTVSAPVAVIEAAPSSGQVCAAIS